MPDQHAKQSVIIPSQSSLEKQNDWKTELANSFYSVSELFERLELDQPDLLEQAQAASSLFKFRVNESYVNKMRKGDPNDPLLLQVLPLQQEFLNSDHFSSDPVGDMQAQVAPGLLHKYKGRVLLVTTGICALHCRYCFRREYPYQDASISQNDWHLAMDYIKKDDSIKEVILSGGDPLMLSDKKLKKLCTQLASIPHINKLRIHSRLPVTLPSRITPSLIDSIQTASCHTTLVVHCNHPNEIDESVRHKCLLLRQAGITLLNQSVLLKGINDSVGILVALSEKMFEVGILPYYLHLLDKVIGAEHFEVNESQAIDLINKTKEELSGYLVPRLVREIQGKPFKVSIC